MGLRALAGRLKKRSVEAHRHWLLARQLRALDRTLRAGATPSAVLLAKLVRGWANESWSAETTYLSSILNWLPKTSGLVLECGSGLSTLVLAVAASVRARHVLSLEHEPLWAARVGDALSASWTRNVELAVTPLCGYGEFDWYSLAGVATPTPIGFIVCDGPPGSTRGGRYGLAPVLRNYMAPGCIILLDDAHRAGERAIIERWCLELSATIVEESTTHCVIQVGRP
jgi:hypothetical protein